MGGGGVGNVDQGRILRMRESSTLITIVAEPNSPISYYLGTEHHCPIMRMIWGHIGRLERDIYIVTHFLHHHYFKKVDLQTYCRLY